MSKVDAQRAMREANYARRHANAPARPAVPAAEATPPAPAARPPKPKPAAVAGPAPTAAVEGELCGHRSMNGRACTREAAHSEKSHRYG